MCCPSGVVLPQCNDNIIFLQHHITQTYADQWGLCTLDSPVRIANFLTRISHYFILVFSQSFYSPRNVTLKDVWGKGLGTFVRGRSASHLLPGYAGPRILAESQPSQLKLETQNRQALEQSCTIAQHGALGRINGCFSNTHAVERHSVLDPSNLEK